MFKMHQVLDIHNMLLRIINKKLEVMKMEKEKEKEKFKDQDRDKEKENKEKPAVCIPKLLLFIAFRMRRTKSRKKRLLTKPLLLLESGERPLLFGRKTTNLISFVLIAFHNLL